MVWTIGFLLWAQLGCSVGWDSDPEPVLPTATPYVIEMETEESDLVVELIKLDDEDTGIAAPIEIEGTLGVNGRYFDGDRVSVPTSAVFWFGDFTDSLNHTDVRVGYNDETLQLVASVFDRQLYYDVEAQQAYEAWDSVSFIIQPSGSNDVYRIESMLYHWQAADGYRRVRVSRDGRPFEVIEDVEISTSTTWYGTAPNDAFDDRGWFTIVGIPFELFGIYPERGDVWRMMVVNHDRDGEDLVHTQTWPDAAVVDDASTWGELRYGWPVWEAATGEVVETVEYINGVDGREVYDTHLGGGANCGIEFDPGFFDGWSDHVWDRPEQVNVQNQMNTEDWPCFSKYFTWFELDGIGDEYVILNAEFTMHYFGNAGYEPGQARGSTLQVFTVDGAQPHMSWRDSPQVLEHIDDVWVEPIDGYQQPPLPITFDVTKAVSDAHRGDRPVVLGVYAADWNLHSGKYFWSGHTNVPRWRPVFRVTYGTADDVPADLGAPIFMPFVTAD